MFPIMGRSDSTIFGTALRFNGSNSSINIASIFPDNIETDFVISFWVNNIATANTQHLYQFQSNNESNFLAAQITSTTNVTVQIRDGQSRATTIGNALPVSTWKQYCGVYRRTPSPHAHELYIDGVFRGSASYGLDLQNAHQNIYFGRGWDAQESQFRNTALLALVTDIQVYLNTATTQLISDLYNGGSLGGVSSEFSPVLRLINSGIDFSGSQNDQILVNVTTETFTPF